MKHTSVIVLDYLMQGGTFTHGDLEWGLMEHPVSKNNELGFKGARIIDGVEEEIMLGCEVTIGQFIQMCEDLPKDVITAMSASLALSRSDGK